MNQVLTRCFQFGFVFLVLLSTSCTEAKKEKIPYLGLHDIDGRDTTYHRIPDFAFFNQDSLEITNEKLS